MFDLKEELKNLPDEPGVYIMHSADDTVIYVGKAKILKNRVRQYFHSSANHTPKVRAMVSNVAYFEYIITDSEIEALVLECNLIKKYRPKYNILLKDDKQYPYIKVTMNEDYPRIFMTRRLENDGAKYFGPYMGSTTIKDTIEMVRKVFKPPQCARKFPQDIGKGRPCLNYHINNCFAPCTGKVSQQEYKHIYEDICAFLDGSQSKLINILTQQMKEASSQLDFEKAAQLRDKINSIKAITERQKIINSDNQTDMDIIAFAAMGNKAFAAVFFVRSGSIIGRENYPIDNIEGLSEGEIITAFAEQFYSLAPYIPPLVLTQYEVENNELLSSWLSEKRGKKVEVTAPKIGEKKHLMDMVVKNANMALDNYKLNQLKKQERNATLAMLAEAVGLKKEPQRIESYDMSHISGSDNVAAMVVFKDGKPKPSLYRRFKIRYSVADDFAAMKEVLYRRFRHALEEQEKIDAGEMGMAQASFLPLPDLILLDGGKGQLSSAAEIMEQMEIDIPIFGMVKNSKHKTRGLLAVDGKEIELSPVSGVFKFITRVQDEVHKTAIEYHRKLRNKSTVKSELDNISGVGDKRKQLLLERFKTVKNIKSASLDELKAVKGIDAKTAQSVYEYFNNKDGGDYEN